MKIIFFPFKDYTKNVLIRMKTVQLMHGVNWNHKAAYKEENWQIEERAAKCELHRLYMCKVMMISQNMKGGAPLEINSRHTRVVECSLVESGIHSHIATNPGL